LLNLARLFREGPITMHFYGLEDLVDALLENPPEDEEPES
jgi:hypothetical protein